MKSLSTSYNSKLGILLTLLFIVLGIYVAIINHKKEGFWMGVLALFLISSTIVIGKVQKEP